jgi:hypothetical protein
MRNTTPPPPPSPPLAVVTAEAVATAMATQGTPQSLGDSSKHAAPPTEPLHISALQEQLLLPLAAITDDLMPEARKVVESGIGQVEEEVLRSLAELDEKL